MEDGRLRQKSGRRYKESSIDTARSQLRAFKAEFGDRTLDSLTRHEAVRWAEGMPAGSMQSTVALFTRALDDELLDRNPSRGLGRRVAGRKVETPPTPQEFAALLDACAVHGEYAARMRALIVIAAHSLMRPGEAMAIEWSDVDLPANRGHVRRGLYRGRVDLPKSNRERTFALTPPARDALLTLPERDGLVFRNKTGGQLTQPTLTAYWKEVKARARLDFDFYMATKH
jgi:integrase